MLFFFPFINSLIPKTYLKITNNHYQKLNILKPLKNKSIRSTIFPPILLLPRTLTRNTYLFHFQLQQLIVSTTCFIPFLDIIFFYSYL
ncbi:DUF443 family protein, partial [Staphylococcus aureus]|uniref:DUF443 family protein n=1 Tax=Staphylococcus aureus TaxID=1280 RepID=UPI0011A20895